jgi:isopenicillin-N N-acyltransferase-like protein
VYPTIEVSGSARERGRGHGEAARERVHRSIEGYKEVFAHYAGWDWARTREEAARFRAPIEAYGSEYAEEIAGIAEGAAVDEGDVLALNVRTEVMFAATARDVTAGRRLPAECSAFALLPPRTAPGTVLLGQNWDWLLHATETIVIIKARRDGAPDYITVVEAGLLAKFGMNSSGVGVVTNALVSGDDRGNPGVPYHVLLRAILDAETISDALTALQRAGRSSSGNFLVAHEDGVALDVEAAPGGHDRLFLRGPEDGVLLHANHFTHPRFAGADVGLVAMPDSPFRLQRLEALFEQDPRRLDSEELRRLLADHATFPLGICCHPDMRLPGPERSATLASVVMDLPARRMWLAPGNPCVAPWDELDHGAWLRKPSPAADTVSFAL